MSKYTKGGITADIVHEMYALGGTCVGPQSGDIMSGSRESVVDSVQMRCGFDLNETHTPSLVHLALWF